MFKFQRSLFLFLLSLLLVLTPVSPSPSLPVSQIIQQGRLLYEAGKYSQAIATIQPAVAIYQQQQDSLRAAMVHNNLALAYQQLGKQQTAQENIDRSFSLLDNMPQSVEKQTILAQALDIQGKLNLNGGKARRAWSNWEQAAINYQAIDNKIGMARSRINQAQALQSLGFYRRALKTIEKISKEQQLQNALIWRSVGNVFLALGEFDRAESSLLLSLDLAQESNSSSDISKVYFSLGNLTRSQGDLERAKTYYQQAIQTAPDLMAEVRSRLNLLSVSIASEDDYHNEIDRIRPLLKQLPINRQSIYAKVNYAQNIFKINRNIDTAKDILESAIAEARQLEDPAAEAYSLKSLGEYYARQQQWQPAIAFTQQSLIIAQQIDAKDIAYQGQWQLGKIYQQQGKTEAAIAAYRQTVELLQSLRSDLIATSSEAQFTFRESIEPIYRQYVSLLLDSEESGTEKLIAARNAIDSLQLAELENFFQATCLNAQPVAIDSLTDKTDLATAFIYPIVLADRFEIILKLPQQPLRHYSTAIENSERVARILTRFSQTLAQRNSRETLPLGKLIYSWLIEPISEDLAQNNIETLVFVLDSSLRNIPMSALHDGKQYLIEKYAVAITPGLQLIQPQAIANRELQALTAGITKARSGFPPLKFVANELKTIQAKIGNTQQLIDREFTNDALQSQIANIPFPIVHLATHGQFSSQVEHTFVLTWNDRLNVNQLSNLLQQNSQREGAIELLVLSACETLTGDRRAALGLAGVAVKAGARSTLATLWRVNDEATSELMGGFYQELANPAKTITKAEAIRQAQLKLLQSDRFKQPHFWAAYILVGNWL